PAQASTPAPAPSGPIVPKIINRPAPSENTASQPAPVTPAPVTVVPKAAATPEPGPKLAALPPPPPKEAVAPVPEKPAQPVAMKKDETVPVTIFSVMPSPVVGAVGLLA